MQPLAAARAGTHPEVVTAIALASLRAMLASPEDPRWGAWLAHRWTKTVRRGTRPQVDAARPFAIVEVQIGEARALGFAPTTYDNLPPPLVKMQVAHFERPREAALGDPGIGPIVAVNPTITMSTGKTAAQAAHGLFRWFLGRSTGERDEWARAGHPLWARTDLEEEVWPSLLAAADAVIHDSGLTETEPGSLTVAVTHRSSR